jgi:hypothetical protein
MWLLRQPGLSQIVLLSAIQSPATTEGPSDRNCLYLFSASLSGTGWRFLVILELAF